jgi:F-type H+-transporting ATPase subunit b
MLNINLTTILFQFINFIVLVVILYFLLFKKIFSRVQQRKEELEEIKQATIRNFEESEKAKINLQNQIENAQTQIDERIAQAKSELEVSRYQIIDATKVDAEKIIKQALESAEFEQKRSIENFNDELTTSIMEIVKQILFKHSPDVIHNSLVQQTNERIWELGKKEMDRVETIRRSLKDREPALSVETAFPLSKEQQANIVRTFSALADKNVKIDTVLKKDLGSGVRIRLGDFIINNSLDALLDEIEKEASLEVNNLLEKYNGK